MCNKESHSFLTRRIPVKNKLSLFIHPFVRINSIFICLSFILLSCQTPMHQSFSRIHNEMNKDEVLEILGNPKHTQRAYGEDRWVYKYFHNDHLQVKHVHFKNGKVIYFGNKPKPKLSAEEQDKINIEEQIKRNSQNKENEKKAKKAFQIYEDELKKDKNSEKTVPTFIKID